MIVFDANVIIAFLDASDAHHRAAQDLIERRFVDGFSASVITVAEALVHPTRADRQDAALTSLARIGLTIVALNPADASALARIRNDYRLRMPDAVALLTAITTGSELATFDDSLSAAAKKAGVLTTTQNSYR